MITAVTVLGALGILGAYLFLLTLVLIIFCWGQVRELPTWVERELPHPAVEGYEPLHVVPGEAQAS